VKRVATARVAVVSLERVVSRTEADGVACEAKQALRLQNYAMRKVSKDGIDAMRRLHCFSSSPVATEATFLVNGAEWKGCC
jgi:hypothetical protein